MSSASAILVGCVNKVVWIRVDGKGSFLNSSGLKEFTKEMINRGHRQFVVDLHGCTLMDSTFMGTLAGVALRLRELGQGDLHVVNVNPRNTDLLHNLGLDQLFASDMCGVSEEVQQQAQQYLSASVSEEDRSSQAKTMLEAHEALVEADPKNILKFKDVLDYLKQDLQQEQ